MKTQEIIELDQLISEKIENDPENCFEFFKEKWKMLSVDDKKIFVNFRGKFNPLVTYSNFIRNSEDHINDELKSAYKSQIFDFINKELNGQPEYGNLNCGPNIKPVDIACVFKILYDLKYLDNKLEEIENVITQVFKFKKGTIHSYLNDPEKLKKAAKEFRKLVDESPSMKS